MANKNEYTDALVSKYELLRSSFDGTDHIVFPILEGLGISGKSVLDLGCGAGKHLLRLTGMEPSQLTGIDLSESMIRQARISTLGFNVSLYEGDARFMPVPDCSQDVVFSNFVLHYFHDLKDILKEISRVLSPQGFGVLSFNISELDQEFEHLWNTEMPIQLGGDNGLVVHNLIKNKEEFLAALSFSQLRVTHEEELEHPAAIIFPSWELADKVKKKAMLFVVQKE